MILIKSKSDEIKRLSTPLTFKNSKAYDDNGKIINSTETLYDVRYIIEPDENLLSDDEILQYAPQSKSASKIRIKRGTSDISDILLIHESLPQILGLLYVILICISIPIFYMGNKFIMLGLLIVYIVPLIYLYIIFNSKRCIKHKTSNKKTISKNSNKKSNDDNDKCIDSLKSYKKDINDLKILFDVKKEVVRDLIEKRFEPPQITYDKFISMIDKSEKLFNTQYETGLNIINLAIEDTPRIREEINNKINAMKAIIDQIENLTNELVININDDEKTDSEVKNLLEDMENLIDSVKKY